MNDTSLKAKINNKSKQSALIPQELMQMYFFERILYRISISKYKNNFILKGGLLLSAIFGEKRRTTQDMDTMIKGIELNDSILYEIIEKILNIKTDDNIKFKIIRSKNIRVEDRYGGMRISLLAIKDNLRVNLKIDITTKDPIIPRELEFKYKSMFSDEYIKIMAFTCESIIAEKFQTLIEDTENDTRAKDYYDLHMLMKQEINRKNLRKAIFNTFKRRDSIYMLNELDERFEVIKTSLKLKNNWDNFIKLHTYAKDISYNDILLSIEQIILLYNEHNLVSQ